MSLEWLFITERHFPSPSTTLLWQLEPIRDLQEFTDDPDALVAGRIRALLPQPRFGLSFNNRGMLDDSRAEQRSDQELSRVVRRYLKDLPHLGKLSIDFDFDLPQVGPRQAFRQITAKRPILGPLREGIEPWILPEIEIHFLAAIRLESAGSGLSRLTAEYVNAFATALLGPGTARPSASHSACPHR